MSVNGIGKQFAPSVDCTTHDCFTMRYFPRSCRCDTDCTKLHFIRDMLKLT
jgi:hypothetical protein